MSKDGFATFISDDLPGFNSLNGSGFFDMAGNWNDFDEFDEGNPADEDGFGEEECVAVISKANPATVKEDVYFCLSGDEDDEDLMGASSMGQSSRRDTPTSQGIPRSCRRRSTAERPKGERKPRTTADGKRRPMRRSKTVIETSDAASVSSRRSALRRNKTADGSTRKMGANKQSSKRSENLKKKSLDLGSKLSKLEAMNNEPSEVAKGGRRMRRPSSNRNLLSDETTVVSRGAQSTAGASVSRGGARRRRASQQHDLLARNLRHYAKANESELRRSSTTTDCNASTGGKEEVWRERRRRSVQALTAMPAIAA